MGLLEGKKILIVGVLSNKSIAYGIANEMHKQGASLSFTYQNDRVKKRVETLTSAYSPALLAKCDVSDDSDITKLFNDISKIWHGLDGIVHSVAYSPKDQLEGDFISKVTREGFRISHDISAYSFLALAKAGSSIMKYRPEGASLLTVSYLGSERAIPNYNTMGLAKASLESAVRYSALSLGKYGIRVNAVSPGPIRTLASSGIKGFKKILNHSLEASPLKKNVTITNVGNVMSFLASDYSHGITGEVIHVDSGYHCVGAAESI